METNYTTHISKLYNYWKEKHPNRLLLFLVDGFYEAHEQDANTCNKVLGTARFPQSELSTQLRKLIQAGVKVGVCSPITEKEKITIRDFYKRTKQYDEILQLRTIHADEKESMELETLCRS